VDFVQLDLSDRESIKAFAQSIVFPKIDFLVNNSGVMNIPTLKLTKEGV
jgi:NAD(P)-dependent dehydrogenase (short-subunit alcohol dehydrogenase family)